MEEEIEKKIKDLKKFIKQKTDQGTANYLGKEIRELCGMVETQALNQHDVSGRSELLVSFLQWYVKDEAQRENKELITSIVERYLNETN